MVARSQHRQLVVRSVASRVLTATAAAIALVSASGFAKAADTGPQASLAKSASVSELVNTIKGEWEGSVQVHSNAAASPAANDPKNARNSASIVGISATASNAQCSAVFAGAAFGKPFDGALIWNASDNSAAWVVGDVADSPKAVQASLVSAAPGVLTFASTPEAIKSDARDNANLANNSPTQHYEQVVRLDQEGHVKIELARVVSNAQGQHRERIATFDVVKLPAGEPSLASGMASSSPQLALAQATINQSALNAPASTATASAE
jgi:hypothetical protein